MNALRRLRAFAAFLYDLLVGDDWHVALLVVGAVFVTTLLAHHVPGTSWIVLAALVIALPYTVWRGTRR